MQGQNKKERLANIELLRIFAMFLIVFGHSVVHSLVRPTAQFLSSDYFVVWGIIAFIQCGIDVFVLISGYFLSAAENPSPKRVLPLAKLTWFYSIGIFLLLFAAGYAHFSLRAGLHVFFPIITYSYWFITLYILLSLISPLLNIIINRLSKAQLGGILAAGMVIYTFWVVFMMFFPPPFDFLGHLLWFIYLYFAGAYIRLYYKADYKPWKFLAAYAFFCLITLAAKISATYLLISFKGADTGSFLVYKNYFFPTFFSAVAIFLFFLNIKVNNSLLKKLILFAAPSVLGVYLITEQFLLRLFIWHIMFAGQFNYHGWILAVYFFCGALIVFISALCIDILRRQIVAVWRKYV